MVDASDIAAFRPDGWAAAWRVCTAGDCPRRSATVWRNGCHRCGHSEQRGSRTIARWQGVRRDKIVAIPHGVDCDRFRFDSNGRQCWHREWRLESACPRPFIVGTAGRLSREKRH